MEKKSKREEKEIMINWAYYIVLPKADTELTSSLQSSSLRSKSQGKKRHMMSFVFFISNENLLFPQKFPLREVKLS